MEIREFLELNSSRLNADMLADRMEEDPSVLEEVWTIMLEDRDPVSMRAAWSLGIFEKRHPGTLDDRSAEIADILPGITSHGVRRCLLSLISRMPVPEEQSGFLFDFCYTVLESPGWEIGHKVHAMTILYNISESQQELKPELIALFESLLEDESSAIIARSRNILSRLYRDLSLPDNQRYRP